MRMRQQVFSTNFIPYASGLYYCVSVLFGIKYNRDGIGAILRKVRLENGSSLKDIERITGISKAQISRIERGQFNATVDTFVKLAISVGVPPAALLENSINCDWKVLLRTARKDKALLDTLKQAGIISTNREMEAISFCANCVRALARLLWVADPVPLSKGLVLPYDGLRDPFVKAAQNIEATFDSAERVNSLIALERRPSEELARFGLFSIGLLMKYLEELEKGNAFPPGPLDEIAQMESLLFGPSDSPG